MSLGIHESGNENNSISLILYHELLEFISSNEDFWRLVLILMKELESTLSLIKTPNICFGLCTKSRRKDQEERILICKDQDHVQRKIFLCTKSRRKERKKCLKDFSGISCMAPYPERHYLQLEYQNFFSYFFTVILRE